MKNETPLSERIRKIIEQSAARMRAEEAVSKCDGCGTPTPREWSNLMERFYCRCAGCKLKALAAFIEEPSPGDTIADISRNEQTGAWLRGI